MMEISKKWGDPHNVDEEGGDKGHPIGHKAFNPLKGSVGL